ncbi:MAG: hypothetical protein FWH11_14900 [Micrococcales bacterium]|nr:hypothetical protein [Micrococcales bacterium]
MARLRRIIGRPGHRRGRLTVVAVLVLAGLVGLPFAAAASTQTAAAKRCAEAPDPARPDAGLPGLLYSRPSATSDDDPFAPGSTTTVAEVYGYGYRWQTYDNGCLPGSDVAASTSTGIGNVLLGLAASVNALTHTELTLVITPTWLEGLDKAVAEATIAVRNGFFGPWVTPVVLVLACMLLWAASRADMARTATTVGWAGLVLVTTTYVMSYPTATAEAVDGVIQSAVTTAAHGQLPTLTVPYAPGYEPDPNSLTERLRPGGAESAAQDAIDRQLDIVNRNTLYKAWLTGTLGSSTSTTAVTYGPDLFKASHLSWREAALVDAGQGKDIVDAKKKLWEDTAAKVQDADGDAYGQLTGNHGRWDGVVVALFSVACTMTFLVVAGFLVVVSYLAVRVLIPLAPALGVFGMLRPLSGWMMGVVKRVATIVAAGPIFFAAALVNLIIVTAVIGHGVLGIILSVMVPTLLFSMFRPRGMAPVQRLARQGRRRISRLRTHLTRRHDTRRKNQEKRRRSDSGSLADWHDRGPVYSRRRQTRDERLQRASRPGKRTAGTGQPVPSRRRQVAGHPAGSGRPTDRRAADAQTGPGGRQPTRRQNAQGSQPQRPRAQHPRNPSHDREKTGQRRTEQKRKEQKRKVAAAATRLAAQVVVEMAKSGKHGKAKTR